MHRIAHFLLLALFWLLGGGLMLASGRAPLGVMLLLIGTTLPMLVIARALARRDTGRHKAAPVTRGLEAWLRLQRIDLLWIVLSMAVGLGIAAFGMTCRCGAA